MEHPFANYPDITTLDADNTEHVSGAFIVSRLPIQVTRPPIEARPPVFSTMAVGEEGGIYPEPENQ